MIRSTKKTSIKRFVIALAVALLGFVVALQCVYGSAAGVLRGGSYNSSAHADDMNGVKVSYSDAEGSIDDSEYRLTDSSVEGGVKTSAPAPSKEVGVIISLNGTPMMDYAAERGMTVSEALKTVEGKNNLNNLETVRSLALGEISKYIIEKRFDYTTVVNAFSATVKYGDIAAIEKCKYVKNVMLDNTYLAPDAVTSNYVDVYETGIFNSSGIGYDGTGTVVGVLDTGTDYTHEVFDMELNPNTLAITKDDVAAVAPALAATSQSAIRGYDIDEDDLYLTSKLPYAYDYADSDTNVFPKESHGTHVAGIIAGKSEKITGVAVGAQIATFKVFSDYTGGAKTEWIMAALNDAVTLGVDAINMSLGSSCGFTREVDEVIINQVYDSVNAAGICLVVAASNDASSAQGSTWGNTNLASNPDSGTVGSPGSYTASLSVASVSGVKTKYFIAEGKEVYFAESRLIGKIDPNDFVKGMLGDKQEGEFEYVVIPGVGMSVNYQGYDVKGKIAVVQRGNTNFEEKVRVAATRGAIGVIVYNNVSGTITMSVGSKEVIPSCFITMDLAKEMVAAGSGKIYLSKSFLAGPFMSDFSSWGALPNLVLAPDITAHGGEIYSAVAGKDLYDKMSGTSMACPNLAGALILVRQFVKENSVDAPTTQIRDESYSRMMSTATIVKNEEGNPYSPRKQGAGIANIENSINTKAYLTVDGLNKPKLSIGDDPTKSGVYTLKFNLVNASGSAICYSLDQFVMTESMSSDDRTVSEKPHMFTDTTNTYSVVARKGSASISGNTVFVGGYGEATITVTITLSQADKQYMNELFINGMFLEGYVLLESNNADCIDLNIPYLAFYGDWSQAPMLDVSAYEVGASAVDDSVLEEDKLKPDVYGTLPYAGFYSATGSDNLGYWGMGSFAFLPAAGYTQPVAQEKYAALTTNPDGDYLFYMVNAGLLRNAKRVEMSIRNSATGELLWSGIDYNARKSRGTGGTQVGGMVMVELDIRTLNLPNNAKYTFDMTCYLDWTGDSSYITAPGDPDLSEFVYGNKNTFSFEFTIDNEAPQLSDVAVRKSEINGIDNYVLDLSLYDNHYIQGYAVYTYESKTYRYNGNHRYASYNELTSLTNGVIPVDGEFNTDTLCSLNISGYWDLITRKNEGKLYVTLYDYAKNMTEIEIVIDESVKKDDLKITKARSAIIDENTDREYYIQPNGQFDLRDWVVVTANVKGDVIEADKAYLEGYWMKDLVWQSMSPDIVDVTQDGIITGLKTGDAIIRVMTPDITEFNPADKDHCLEFTVHVAGEALPNIALSNIELSVTALTLERGESATITATLKPFNRTDGDVKIVWSSTSRNVTFKASEDGMSVEIFAAESGSANIRATARGNNIKYIESSCAVTVKQEFSVYENIYLRSYTGRGGDWVNEKGEVEHNVVVIPDDLGVAYIYPGAFQGNNYIRKVIIPEGISNIMRGAFLNCENLEEVVLPESVKAIDTITFAQCSNLKKINLEHVNTIGDSAFWNCTELTEINLENCTYIDKYAFHYCTGLKNLNLGRVGVIGGGAFFLCTGLETLTIPANTSMDYDTTYLEGSDPIDRGAAFGFCMGLKKVIIKSSTVGLHAFRGCTALETVIFENDVDTISALAFNSCISLKNVTFYGSLYKIEDAAFTYCTSLESFTFPKGTSVLGAQLFFGSEELKTIKVSSGALLENIGYNSISGIDVEEFVVEDGNRYLASEDGVLYDRAMRVLLAYPGGKKTQDNTFTVPASVKTIGKSAFSAAPNVMGIDLANVEYIEEMAFAYSRCNAYDANGEYLGFYYTQFVGYNNVKYIGANAFTGSALVNLPFGNNITHIGNYAFSNVFFYPDESGTYINKTFVVPASLKYIGDFAFAGTKATYQVPTDEMDENGEYIMREEVLEISTPFTAISFANGTPDHIGIGAFYHNAYLTTVNLGALTHISDAMFADCDALETINIPVSVTSIGVEAFAFCDSLANIVFNSKTTIKEIPAGAFRGTALTAISIPNTVDVIGDYAFAESELAAVNLSNVTRIGNYAFANTKLVSISSNNTKDNSVNVIGNGAFSGCEELQSAVLPYVQTIGNSAFENCKLLLTLNINSATHIGDRAFSGAISLASVNLSKVTDIGEQAFYGDERITSLDLGSVERIGAEAFYGTSVTEINLPASLIKAEDKAFWGMAKLTDINVAANNATYKSIGGVLYSVNERNFYTLVSYPAGKTATTYSVHTRAIKLSAYSFNANPYLKDIKLSVYMQVIGASAMSGMTALEDLTIYAVAAPTLESNYRITRAPVDEEPGEGNPNEDDNGYVGSGDVADEDRPSSILDPNQTEWIYENYYDNFNFEYDGTGGVDQKLTIHVPANNSGYDARMWSKYVGKLVKSFANIHIQLGTIEFIDEVKAALNNPNITLDEINLLVRIYNMISTAQQYFVRGDYTYSDVTGSIDADYYTEILGGINYYEKLLELRSSVQSGRNVAASSATSPAAVSGEAVNVLDKIAICVTASVMFVFVTGALIFAAKRRGRR